MLPFSLPAPAGFDSPPLWDGCGFRLGGKHVPVLEYSENFAGWSDELTTLHEESSGDTHPIDVASRADAVGQLRRHLSGTRPTILEIGCSSGFDQAMKQAFPDATIRRQTLCGRRALTAEDAERPCFFASSQVPRRRRVDALVMLVRTPTMIRRPAAGACISTRGLLFSVPAGPGLYDAYDAASGIFVDIAPASCPESFMVRVRDHPSFASGILLYPVFAA
jgi:hypothetical protein